MSTYRSRTRSEDEDGTDRSLFCTAHGCPNRWSVDTGTGRMCSAHYHAEPQRWPEVTAEQNWAETERAPLRGEPPPDVEPMSEAEKRAIVVKLRSLVAKWGTQDPKAWAYRLKSREENFERLTQRQRDAWREAIG